jgi:integrase
MATLYRPSRVVYKLPNGKRCKKGDPGAKKRRERSDKWYALYQDAAGDWKRKPLAADKSAAQAMLNELVNKAERERGGRIDVFEPHYQTPLAEHLADYEEALRAKGDGADHVVLSVARIRAVIDGCGFVRLSDLSASAVAAFLADARQTGLTVIDCKGRRKVDATGVPKRRAISIATSNHYLTAVKGFCRWLVKDRRMPDNPIAHLSALNAKTDVRHERRPLSNEEFTAFIEAARAGKPFRRLSGESRAMLYLVAANTGLRASELASLTAASFDLTGDPPTVTVEAAYSKHRRRDVLPLRADLADRLCPFLSPFDSDAAGVAHNERSAQGDPEAESTGKRKPKRLIWAGTWVEKPAKMLRRDLRAARAKWLADAPNDAERKGRERSSILRYRDEAGRVFDFHALRHQFITNLARGRVHVKEAQQLARHSTITLTMDCYTHLGIVDLTSALDVLPALPTMSGPATEAAELRATGTDGPIRPESLRAQGRAQESGFSCPVVSLSGHESEQAPASETIKKPGRKPGFAGENRSEGDGTRTRNHRIDSPVL